MLRYLIPRMERPVWDAVPILPMQHTGWLSPTPISAWAQLCHDGENLFVRLEAKEQEIRATLTDPLAQVCQDSCLEFFFAPLPGDERYFNFESNPLGTMCLGFGAGRGRRVRQVVQNPVWLNGQPFATAEGWGLNLTISAAFIRLYMPEFSCSGTAAGNFYKCGDRTPVPHYLAWSVPDCDTPDFHRRDAFGLLEFE